MLDMGGGSGTEPARAPAQVIQLHPVRTLVIARDLAFRNRAITILAELGIVSFAIASLDGREHVLSLVTQERPDVVVLDATGCERSVADAVYALYERAPRVGVVVVSANPDDRRLGLAALAKWGWAADLTRAVQHAYRNGNPLTEETTLHAQ